MKKWLGRLTGGGGNDGSGSGVDPATSASTPATSSSSSGPMPIPAAAEAAAAATAEATAPGAPRALDVRALRSLVSDADELRKGTEVFDKGGLAHLARHGDRIFCEAAGSGASPYRVTITLSAAGDTRARCTCMAARSRPICKHAAALLVAWARAPESFAASDEPPVVEGGERRRAAVRTGKVKTEDLIGRGVEQTLALVRELAITGVGSSTAERPEQMRALAETLRANRLRRLSAKVLELADIVQASFRRGGRIRPLAYADTLADILLAARRIEKHLGGDVLEDRHMEELVGRTWRKNDRRPVENLGLLEYAYLTRTTADNFVIRERRLIDIATAIHYSEKQILPAFMARRTAAIPSQRGERLEGTGGVYPGYAPHRLDLEGVASAGPLGGSDVERLLESAHAGPAAALAAFADHRRDVFAPDPYPVLVRADAIVAIAERLAIVGAEGDALLLPASADLLDALEGGRMLAVIGDIELDGILAVLRPLAVVAEGPSGLTIRPTPAAPSAPLQEPVDWLAGARTAGASPGALSLGEIRDELAAAVVNGLGSLTERAAEPLALRMADLGLERPAALLREVVTRPDPVERLDDVVRLHQVLGIGAVRLASGRTVDRAGLIPVPGQPAVLIADPGEPLPPAEVARRRGAGTMTAHEAAVHRSRYLAGLPTAAFRTVAPWWLDSAAAESVADALAGGEPPLELIDRALGLEWGLTAALTAVRILAAVPGRAADERLVRLAMTKDEKPKWDELYRGVRPARALRVAARATLEARTAAGVSSWRTAAPPDEVLAERVAELEGASNRTARADAAEKLAALEDRRALKSLRRVWQADPAPLVRTEAGRALTTLGDVTVVDAFIDRLNARASAEEDAKAAAYALGALADGRGVAALVDALAEGWKTTIVLDALLATGRQVVDEVIARSLDQPEVSRRRGFVAALERRSPQIVGPALAAAFAEAAAGPDPEVAAERAAAILRLAASHRQVRIDIAQLVTAHAFGDSAAAKRLRKSAADVLSPKRRKATAG